MPSTRGLFRAVLGVHLVVSGGRFHVVTGNYIWVLGVMIHRHGRSIRSFELEVEVIEVKLQGYIITPGPLGRRDLRHQTTSTSTLSLLSSAPDCS